MTAVSTLPLTRKMQKEILLVKSSPAGAELISNYLNPRFRIKSVTNTDEALGELKSFEPSIIFFQLHSPDQLDKFNLIRITAPSIPIIVLTELDEANIAINAIRSGADDLLLNSNLNTEVLERSIQFVQEKKTIEVTTRKLQEDMDRFFGTALDMICVANTEGWLIRINPACEKILGFTPAEMCAAPIDSFIHPDDVAKTRAARARLIGGQTLKGFENRYRTKDGKYKTLSWISVIENGVIYAMARDTSERNRLAAQMQQNDRMASLGILAAGVAHEINNPLAHATINLDLLSSRLEDLTCDPDLKDDLKSFLDEAKHGASRVREIVQSLKIFSNKEELKIVPVDLKKVLESAIKFASHEISIRAQLVTDFTESIYVAGNESRLGQVFINLLVNAAQAIPEGQSRDNTITVRTGINKEGQPFVDVSDTGVGISDETKKKIFDPFFTTKPVGIGTGLGLSICHGIVASFGGTIAVKSNHERGTTFTVTLPPATPANDLAPSDSPTGALNAHPKKLKIIIIDDEINFANALKSILHQKHDVLAEASSATALKLVLQQPDFDIIICDMMMPEMTGMEFYQNLVNDGRGLEKKIVFMSGGAFTPQTISFFETCGNLRLEKPFGISEFLNMIEKFEKTQIRL